MLPDLHDRHDPQCDLVNRQLPYRRFLLRSMSRSRPQSQDMQPTTFTTFLQRLKTRQYVIFARAYLDFI
jgi:hypothetical protein